MWFFMSKLTQVNEFADNIMQSDLQLWLLFTVLLTSVWEQKFSFPYQKKN